MLTRVGPSASSETVKEVLLMLTGSIRLVEDVGVNERKREILEGYRLDGMYAALRTCVDCDDDEQMRSSTRYALAMS